MTERTPRKDVGKRVIILGSGQIAESVAVRLRETGAKVVAVVGEVTGANWWDDVEARVFSATRELGGLDVFVNQAIGAVSLCAFSKMSPEAIAGSVRSQFGIYAAATRAAIASMSDGGLIVNITSRSGEAGVGGAVVYDAAQGGTAALTRAIAAETSEHRVRAVSVIVGAQHDDPRIGQSAAFDRIAGPEAVVEVVDLVISSGGAAFSGGTIEVRGSPN